MIIFKKFGETVSISNRDWKKLRARFNPHNASFKTKYYMVEKACPFCPKYNDDNCLDCPLDIFTDGLELGCEIFFNKLFPDRFFVTTEIGEIKWHKEIDLAVRKQLGQLQKMMDKIEASQ